MTPIWSVKNNQFQVICLNRCSFALRILGRSSCALIMSKKLYYVERPMVVKSSSLNCHSTMKSEVNRKFNICCKLVHKTGRIVPTDLIWLLHSLSRNQQHANHRQEVVGTGRSGWNGLRRSRTHSFPNCRFRSAARIRDLFSHQANPHGEISHVLHKGMAVMTIMVATRVHLGAE